MKDLKKYGLYCCIIISIFIALLIFVYYPRMVSFSVKDIEIYNFIQDDFGFSTEMNIISKIVNENYFDIIFKNSFLKISHPLYKELGNKTQDYINAVKKSNNLVNINMTLGYNITNDSLNGKYIQEILINCTTNKNLYFHIQVETTINIFLIYLKKSIIHEIYRNCSDLLHQN